MSSHPIHRPGGIVHIVSLDMPPASAVSALLKRLSMPQLRELARLSDVNVGTLNNIRVGATLNPGVETVRKFLALAQRMARARK